MGTDQRSILKLILKKQKVKAVLDSNGLWQDYMEGFCEHSNEFLSSMEGGYSLAI
jgi:hypothetical protein